MITRDTVQKIWHDLKIAGDCVDKLFASVGCFSDGMSVQVFLILVIDLQQIVSLV